MTDVVARIEWAVEVTGRVVDAVADTQWRIATPCKPWDVHTVLNHTVGGMHIFAALLNGTEPGRAHEDDWLGEDPKAAYRAAAAADLAAWTRPGALDTTVRIALGPLPGPVAALVHLTEVCVHGVDIAVATGGESLLDEDLCEHLLTTMRQTPGFDSFRVPGVFGPELPAPADAAPHIRLLAFLGRSTC
ncbi:TIGR03086 family metal-binding protein [Streptomyces sp. NPDC053069]|uniref:TIGR03086 family metal-binding protein n=1 Tax=Streptomyces sp. NPDC053069 TaxID=3365695 RepID=UPI0037D6BA38